jgi:hypothetical protein
VNFLDALDIILQSTEVMPLTFRPMKWQDVKLVPAGDWCCWSCGKEVGANQGYLMDLEGSPSAPTCIRICPRCTAPTYFSGRLIAPQPLLGRTVEHLPSDIGVLYNESKRAAQAGCPTAAVMVCRKILSHVAVERGAPEGSFREHVEYLAREGYIPPNAKNWVDYVRKRGNEANHEILLMSKADADGVLTLTEALLRSVYELPSMVPNID